MASTHYHCPWLCSYLSRRKQHVIVNGECSHSTYVLYECYRPLRHSAAISRSVRPRLEYAAEVWNPNLERDINCIERVQKFALRICSHCYQDSYEDFLHFLYQPTLRNRRIFLSLCTFFKIVKELVYFPPISLTPLPTSTSHLCHPHSFGIPFARCNGLKFSFINASVPLW